MCAMPPEGRGRSLSRPGKTAPEEILGGAPELFTALGYASTSTRRIADGVGIRSVTVFATPKTCPSVSANPSSTAAPMTAPPMRGRNWVVADGALRGLGRRGDSAQFRRGSAARLTKAPVTVTS